MGFEFGNSNGITVHHDTYPFITPSKFTGHLKGKVVLITGASRGIGRSTALAFAAAGASVAALARTAPDVDSLVSEIKTKYNVPAIAVVSDVLTSDPSLIINKVEAQLGSIDILVNNAGTTRMAKFVEEEMDLQTWWRVLEVNVRAPISIIRAVLPSFLKRGKGIVITVGSAAAELPIPLASSYVASKAAIQKAVEILDLELKEKGILNYLIHPGAIKTDLVNQDGAVLGQDVRAVMDGYLDFLLDTLALPADSMVALASLASEGKAGSLSGRYWDVSEDLGEILEKAEKIESEDLYHLKVRKLS